jgi:hypothetical protein
MELAILGALAALGILSTKKRVATAPPNDDAYTLPESARFLYDPKHALGGDSFANPRALMALPVDGFMHPNVQNYDSICDSELAKATAMQAAAVPLRKDRRAAGTDIIRGGVPKCVRFDEDPRVSATAPYYRSGRSQAHSSRNSDSRLESFTGRDSTKASAMSREPPGQLFAPSPNRITHEFAERDVSHVPTSVFQNNTSLVPQQQVGAGVGIGPDVPAAGGFHQFFRILPDNVGQYKANLPGGSAWRLHSGRKKHHGRSSAHEGDPFDQGGEGRKS